MARRGQQKQKVDSQFWWFIVINIVFWIVLILLLPEGFFE